MKYRYIIWDLDGTLLNTLKDLADATNYALRSHKMPEHSEDAIRRFVGNGVRNLIVRAVPMGENNPLFSSVYETFRQYYVEHCQDTTCLYDGVGDALKTLKNEGARMAIVSNKLQAGVDELYDVWFRDTIDIAIGEREGINRKPAPDMVNIAMDLLGATTDNCVYIGDSDVDIMTASNTGLDAISVTWGFRDRSFLIEHGATCLADTPDEVIGIVCGR